MANKKMMTYITSAMSAGVGQILRGHDIPTIIKREISDRPDVIAKIYKIVTSLRVKNSTAQQGFKIYGFPNYDTFLTTSPEAIDDFMGSISKEDQATFTNEENIIVISAKFDTQYDYSTLAANNGVVGTTPTTLMYSLLDENSEYIFNGGSSAIPYMTAINRQQKGMGSSFYLMVCISNSMQAKAEAAKTPQPITDSVEKQKIREAKKQKKLELAAKKKAAGYNQMMAKPVYKQLSYLGDGMDLDALADTFEGSATDYSNYQNNVLSAAKTLTPPDKKFFKTYLKYKKAGNVKAAKLMLKEISDQAFVDMIMNNTTYDYALKLDARKRDIRQQIKGNLDQILKLQDAYNSDWITGAYTEDQLKKMYYPKIQRCKTKIANLQQKLKLYRKDKNGNYPMLSPEALRNRAAYIKTYRERVANAMKKGASPSQAIKASAQSLKLDAASTQNIVQQSVMNMQNGMTANTAAQQAAQQVISNQNNF